MSDRSVVDSTKRVAETTKAHTRAVFALIDRREGGTGGLAPSG